MKDSAKAKKLLGGGGKKVKLDHITPLQSLSTNDKSNLRLVTTIEHNAFTPVENYLGQALHARKITASQAQNWIRRFKNGEITKEQIEATVR